MFMIVPNWRRFAPVATRKFINLEPGSIEFDQTLARDAVALAEFALGGNHAETRDVDSASSATSEN